jgi:eukaryotic-like serine/threonine-protein kinase
MNLVRDTLLNKRYRIVEILGQGGMASVYRAIDENLGVEVAVKENYFTTDEYARQFRLEATILANLRHPNLPRVTDHFVIQDEGQYLVMDYIEGEDLRQRMDRLGVIPEEEVIVIGVAICEALTYLHTRSPKVLHRDIKPGNVKINPQGEIFLVDFGLAKVMVSGQDTSTGARAMTPGFSPPEQYGAARTDHRTDIYSLGATLYAALTDELPEDGMARAMEQTRLTPIRERNPNVSHRLASAIEKALEVRPDVRYQTAEEFRRALLNARSSSRRKNPVELILSPPPDRPDSGKHTGEDQVEAEKDQISEDPSPYYAEEGLRLGGGNALVLPSPGAQPLSSFSRKSPKTGKFSKNRNFLLGVIFLTLFGVLGIVLATRPGILPVFPFFSLTPQQMAASLTGEPSATSLPQRDPTGVVPGGVSLPARTLTPTEAAHATVTPTITRTLRTGPTATRFPTSTPTLLPTPQGGGLGEIAFASDLSGVPNIYTINIDGKNMRQLTDLSEGACQPDWSPDGSRLVFISPCRTVAEEYRSTGLYIINADGSELTPLPSAPGGDYDPAWSPDGRLLAFTTLRARGTPQIAVLNLETNEFTMLSDPDGRPNSQPAWSPDGKRLAFVGPRNQIWVMNANGSDRILVSRPSDYINRLPHWSADNQTIVFTQFEEGRAGAPWLATVMAEVNSLTAVISTDAPMSRGAFSPDGFWLVFQSSFETGFRDIYIMTQNGVGRQKITNTPAHDFDPVFRPGSFPPTLVDDISR